MPAASTSVYTWKTESPARVSGQPACRGSAGQADSPSATRRRCQKPATRRGTAPARCHSAAGRPPARKQAQSSCGAPVTSPKSAERPPRRPGPGRRGPSRVRPQAARQPPRRAAAGKTREKRTEEEERRKWHVVPAKSAPTRAPTPLAWLTCGGGMLPQRPLRRRPPKWRHRPLRHPRRRPRAAWTPSLRSTCCLARCCIPLARWARWQARRRRWGCSLRWRGRCYASEGGTTRLRMRCAFSKPSPALSPGCWLRTAASGARGAARATRRRSQPHLRCAQGRVCQRPAQI